MAALCNRYLFRDLRTSAGWAKLGGRAVHVPRHALPHRRLAVAHAALLHGLGCVVECGVTCGAESRGRQRAPPHDRCGRNSVSARCLGWSPFVTRVLSVPSAPQSTHALPCLPCPHHCPRSRVRLAAHRAAPVRAVHFRVHPAAHEAGAKVGGVRSSTNFAALEAAVLRSLSPPTSHPIPVALGSSPTHLGPFGTPPPPPPSGPAARRDADDAVHRVLRAVLPQVHTVGRRGRHAQRVHHRRAEGRVLLHGAGRCSSLKWCGAVL